MESGERIGDTVVEMKKDTVVSEETIDKDCEVSDKLGEKVMEEENDVDMDEEEEGDDDGDYEPSQSDNGEDHEKKRKVQTKEVMKRAKCTVCSKSFKYQSILRAHMKTHVNVCPECNEHFTCYYALRRHLSRVHREKIQCTMCDYTHKLPSQVRRHFEQCHVKGINCPVAGCTMIVAFNRLMRHIKTVHPESKSKSTSSVSVLPPIRVAASHADIRVFDVALRCELCEFTTEESLEQLEMHVQSVHGGGVLCPHPSCRSKDGEEGGHGVRIHLSELSKHIDECHADDARLPVFHTIHGSAATSPWSETISDIDTIASLSSSINGDGVEEEEERQSIDGCTIPPSEGSTSTTSKVIYSADPDESGVDVASSSVHGDMEEDKDQRSDEDDLDEEIEEMEAKVAAKRNQKDKQGAVPDFSADGLLCATCGKVITSMKALRRHTARVHEKRYAYTERTKRYECTEEGCGKAFTTPGKLQDHMNNHKGVSTYACAHCDKTFASRAYYAKHLKKYHFVSIKDVTAIKTSLTSINKEI